MAADAFLKTSCAMTSPNPSGRYDGLRGAAARRAGALRFAAGFFAWIFFFAGLFFDAFLAMGFPRCCGAFVHAMGGRSRRFARPLFGHLFKAFAEDRRCRQPIEIASKFVGPGAGLPPALRTASSAAGLRASPRTSRGDQEAQRATLPLAAHALQIVGVRYLALATDYDGTLAADGRVREKTLAALERLRKSGRRTILVTGRELEDLKTVFPRLDLF